MHSSSARIEVAVDWDSTDSRHRERRLFDEINCRRDLIPSRLVEKLESVSEGAWVNTGIDPAAVLPPYSSDQVVRVPLEAASFRLGGRAFKPFIGHFYPRRFIAGHGGIHARDMRPMRLLEMDEEAYTFDLNHPLARKNNLAVSAYVHEWLPAGEERGGRSNDIILDALESGPGFEAQLDEGRTDFFHPGAFTRIDEAADTEFYAGPRMVSHVDSRCSSLIADMYSRYLPQGGRVLDLMSSLQSHLPATRDDLEVTGLGMNAQEMAANPLLTGHVVHDLNEYPRLPFDDGVFDAMICTASVEYLVKPFDVFRDVARVCKPGSPVMISFSDRCFPPKAIALWSEVHPFERLAIVLDYFRDSGRFTGFYTETVRGYPRPENDSYADRLPHSDPVFFVKASTVGQ